MKLKELIYILKQKMDRYTNLKMLDILKTGGRNKIANAVDLR
jgi:hypothetical protein